MSVHGIITQGYGQSFQEITLQGYVASTGGGGGRSRTEEEDEERFIRKLRKEFFARQEALDTARDEAAIAESVAKLKADPITRIPRVPDAPESVEIPRLKPATRKVAPYYPSLPDITAQAAKRTEMLLREAAAREIEEEELAIIFILAEI
jgi:hypothetical protein